MELIDTHSHLYEPEFDTDRETAVARAREADVTALLLPAIDAASDERLFDLCRNHLDFGRIFRAVFVSRHVSLQRFDDVVALI